MTERYARETRDKSAASENTGYVAPRMTIVVAPGGYVPVADTEPKEFTKEAFEGALDKVSRPVKGKYADMLPSSEEFIRDKRKEVELEDRSS